jgi:Polyketide cyclase / dehydrase and lipid transport
MIHAHSDIEIAAPADTIWPRLTDHHAWDKLLPMHCGWPDGPTDNINQGPRFRQRLGHLGIHDTVTVTVTDHQTAQLLVLHAEGNYGADARITFRLTPRSTHRTLVRIDIDVLGKLVRPISTLARLGLQNQLQRTTRELAEQIT